VRNFKSTLLKISTRIMAAITTNGHELNGDVDMNPPTKENALRFSSGLILPPPEIKCECNLV
jgi:hypothetical protein